MRKIKNKKIREKAGVAGGCLERGGRGNGDEMASFAYNARHAPCIYV